MLVGCGYKDELKYRQHKRASSKLETSSLDTMMRPKKAEKLNNIKNRGLKRPKQLSMAASNQAHFFMVV